MRQYIHFMYDIKLIKSAKQKIEQPKCSDDQILPRYPFSFILSGRSGSGKTMVLINMLTNKNMYGGYFHGIIVFSPTAGSFDDTYRSLKIPKENYIHEITSEKLNQIIEARKAKIAQLHCNTLRQQILIKNNIETPRSLSSFSCRLVFPETLSGRPARVYQRAPHLISRL